MKRLTFIFPAIAIAIVLASCERSFEEIIFRDEKLSMSRIDYTGSELRTDGYYIKYDTVSGDVQASTKFLYRNGVTLGGYIFSLSECDFEDIEEEYADGSYHKQYCGDKLIWGIYQIKGNSIVFEGWTHDHDGKYSTFKQYGTILNDTTFHVYKRVFKEETTLDNTYHFKQFASKPDSTNTFIK